MNGWQLLREDAPGPGAIQMARDAALLDYARLSGHPTLRLYRWSPYCISFGRHEAALRRFDRAAIETRRLDTVRRPTGGRAVWHARELTYAVAMPCPAASAMRPWYAELHARFADAVSALGAAAALAPDAKAPAPDAGGACFDRPVGGEVTVGGKKVVGSAQYHAQGAMLQQGSMLLEDDQQVLRELQLGGGTRRAEAPLAELVGRAVSFGEAAEAVVAAFTRAYGPPHTLAPDALDAGTAAHVPLYADPAWTWRR